MGMRTIVSAAVLGLLGFAAVIPLANAQPPMPRKAPEITIVETSGNKIPLSSYKGKVVVLALVSTVCPHCQKECEMLTQLYSEMKPKGVQMAAIAFNDNAAVLVPGFIRDHGIMFPVGSAPAPTVLEFLGFSVMDRYNVPQVAVIDKKGMIRAQSGPMGDTNLQDMAFLRNLLNNLASEGATTSGKAAPTAKTAAKGSSN
jgi:peroxiredoxin